MAEKRELTSTPEESPEIAEKKAKLEKYFASWQKWLGAQNDDPSLDPYLVKSYQLKSCPHGMGQYSDYPEVNRLPYERPQLITQYLQELESAGIDTTELRDRLQNLEYEIDRAHAKMLIDLAKRAFHYRKTGEDTGVSSGPLDYCQQVKSTFETYKQKGVDVSDFEAQLEPLLKLAKEYNQIDHTQGFEAARAFLQDKTF